MIPPLNDHGYLPPPVHPATLDEIEGRRIRRSFVDLRAKLEDAIEPRGEGTLVALLSDKPIDAVEMPEMPQTFATPAAARAAIRRIGDELAREFNSEGASAHPPWSIAIRQYRLY